MNEYCSEDLQVLVRCPLCQDSRAETLFDFPPFRVVLCTECGFSYLNPRLREVKCAELYQDSSYYHGGVVGYDNYQEQEMALRATFRHLLRKLGKLGVAKGELLEVGCAYGYFLDEARRYFASLTGLDFCEAACLRARAVGAEVFRGGLAALPEDRRFDLVAAIQTLEHVYEPIPFLQDLFARTRPGGGIVAVVPAFGSVWYHLMQKSWPSFKVPEHVSFFTVKTLARALERAGYRAVARVAYPHAFPLSLIAAKFGVSIFKNSASSVIGRMSVWLPSASIACIGRREK